MKGILFDFDGLILDTEMPVYQAWAECYRDHGQELPLATYTQCVGSDFAQYNPATELETRIGRTLEWGELDRTRSRRVRELLEGAEPLPGVRDLLNEAESAGVPCAVASSSPRIWVEPWLERLELRRFFRAVVTVDDVERPKPSPELFETALRRLDLEPGHAVVLEDSGHGLQASIAAGIACVVVPNEVTAGLDFTGAALRLESLEGLSLSGLSRVSGAPGGNF